MTDKTGISWTDATWNPIVGCSVVSPGCTNCYAMRQAARIIRCSEGAGRASHYDGTIETVKNIPVWTGKVALAPDHVMTAPLRWRKPRRIFVNSMGDLFHESVPDEWIDRVFALMALAPQHSFQVLTKRSTRMREYISRVDERGRWPGLDLAALMASTGRWSAPSVDLCNGWPLPNVWLGVTAENQTRADERIPDLLATPAALRLVSIEPFLGPVDIERWLRRCNAARDGECLSSTCPQKRDDEPRATGRHCPIDTWPDDDGDTTPLLDWVIVGGESGPGARPMHPDWARTIRDQCAAARVPFHFKQWGEYERASPAWDGGVPDTYDMSGCIHVERDGNVVKEHENAPAGAWAIRRVGKHRAGHLLDGVAHREFPETRP